MGNLGENIKRARIKKGLTQKQLAALIGAKHNSISNWETGQNNPDPDTIELLCGVLGVSIKYLFGTTNEDNPICETYNSDECDLIKVYRQLSDSGKADVRNFATYTLTKEQSLAGLDRVELYAPILGKTAAGSPIEYGDTLSEPEMHIVPKGTDYVLTVKGDSMEPLIKDGSVIFVAAQPDVESGQIAVIEVDGGVTCKKVIKSNSHVELHSLNEKYPLRIISGGDFRILGKVII